MEIKEQVIPKWFKGQVYEQGDIVTNPFSRKKYQLNGIELSMYDFIIGTQLVFEKAPKSVTKKMIDDFHKGLNWFRKNNVDAYMVLLD